MSINKIPKNIQPYINLLLENKTVVTVYALCLVLIFLDIYLYTQKVQVSKSISDLQFSLKRLERYAKQKQEVEKELIKLQSQLKSISSKWMTAQSDALIFAKVQTLLNEVCKRHNLTLSDTSISTTTTIYDHIKKTRMMFRVKGPTPNVIRFIEDFEQVAKSFGMYIQEASVYIERYYRRQKNVTLCAFFRMSIIWKEGAES